MRLIGLAGLARTGKDTTARRLETHGFGIDWFAAPIRKAVADTLGVSLPELEQIKDSPIGWLDGVTPRRMMQTLGKEWGCDMIHPQIWIKSLFNRIDPVRAMVIADVRDDFEAEAVRARDGLVVHIARPGVKKVETHITESGVTFVPGDAKILNDGSLFYLFRQVDSLVFQANAA